MPVAVVTGGAGFLGSHLCDRLIADGCRVIAVDNLSTGSAGNLQHLIAHPRFEFMRHDVTKPLPSAVGSASRMYNLACPASPHLYQRVPVETTLASVLGVWQL